MSNLLAYFRTTSFRTNLIAALATFVVLLVIAFYSLRAYTKHGEGLDVPELRGMQIDEAINKLQAMGFRYEVDSVYIMDQTPGVVTDQDPEAKTFVKTNRIIYLTINTNSTPNMKFPDLLQKSFREAKSILESYGLKLGDTSYKSDIARDVVLEAEYAGRSIQQGDNLPKGSRINLVLGDGQGGEVVELPNLVGLTLDEAKFSLKGAMLNLGQVIYEGAITDSANAVIIRQNPAPIDTLNTVKIGSNINIILSNQKQIYEQ